MSNLSELLPTGGGQNAVDFVASGTLSSGQAVALKSSGQVEAVAGVAQGVGAESVFESAQTDWITSTFDSNSNKVVIAYKDDANSNYGTAVVGTVSGTSISFGTPVVFLSGYTFYTSAVYDSANNKIVIAYRDSITTNYGTAVVGTVSGTSISFGTAVIFNSATSAYFAATYDSTNEKIVIAYQNGGNSSYGTAIVGTVSGTSISFGTAVVFETANVSFVSVTFDSTNNKVIIAYKDAGNSSHGTAVVGTVSSTAISFGTPVVFNAGTTSYTASTFNSSLNKIVISYNDGGNSGYGTTVVGTVSGTSISFGAETVFNTANTFYIGTTYDSNNNKPVIAYRDAGNSFYGTAVVFTVASTNLSATTFLGITAEAISSGATGAINTYGGINTAQTGLTIASDYYVQADGSLSTTTSTVKAGQAISATTINLKDLT